MKIAVVGLGYVGLPIALAFARKFADVVGFDVDEDKVNELRNAHDRTHEISADILRKTTLRFTANSNDLKGTNFFIVAVPTPIDKARRPDLTLLLRATEAIGRIMQRGAIVVYESTVYPGVTEDICRPELARSSGLRAGIDFKVGYSPERINPGDKSHTLERVVKVVAGEDHETMEIIAQAYAEIVEAGIYRAPSIKVAEAAKVIENTQRDLNIALMNELAIIFGKMGICTSDVLATASTKWNFLSFRPGLVGGHCIGVDPYYLTHKAEELGYQPQVILAGRRINDYMGKYVAEQTVKLLARTHGSIKGAKVGVLGLTFKENIPDLRNSRVPDIIAELTEYGIEIMVHDPVADSIEAQKEYGLTICAEPELVNLDAVILAVAHEAYVAKGPAYFSAMFGNRDGVMVDVKSAFSASDFPAGTLYWSL